MKKYNEVCQTIRFVIGCLLAAWIIWILFGRSASAQEYRGFDVIELKDSINEIVVIRMSPAEYDFNLLCSNQFDRSFRTGHDWAVEENQLAVINAGMYMANGKSVGYMKNYLYVSNPTVNSYNCILAFNPKYPNISPVMIIDKTCDAWNSLLDSYYTYVQGIRMIDTHQNNCWTQQPSVTRSMSSVGVDKAGNVLFMYSKKRITGHDFVDMILASDLDIYNALYMDGGVPAGVYIKGSSVDYMEYPIPNVIGVTRK